MRAGLAREAIVWSPSASDRVAGRGKQLRDGRLRIANASPDLPATQPARLVHDPAVPKLTLSALQN